MSSIKNVVKVMNFHSLLRVDRARKRAEKYLSVGKEITNILTEILYNKNLVLDKQALVPDKSKPILDIYIANDYGYCGNFNSTVRRAILENKDNYKIIIGKKILYKDDLTVMKIEKDLFEEDFIKIQHYIEKSLIDMSYSEINIYFNYYISKINHILKVDFVCHSLQHNMIFRAYCHKIFLYVCQLCIVIICAFKPVSCVE